jgi:hypothetical protein
MQGVQVFFPSRAVIVLNQVPRARTRVFCVYGTLAEVSTPKSCVSLKKMRGALNQVGTGRASATLNEVI